LMTLMVSMTSTSAFYWEHKISDQAISMRMCRSLDERGGLKLGYWDENPENGIWLNSTSSTCVRQIIHMSFLIGFMTGLWTYFWRWWPQFFFVVWFGTMPHFAWDCQIINKIWLCASSDVGTGAHPPIWKKLFMLFQRKIPLGQCSCSFPIFSWQPWYAEIQLVCIILLRFQSLKGFVYFLLFLIPRIIRSPYDFHMNFTRF
jgi:hypothetical protein